MVKVVGMREKTFGELQKEWGAAVSGLTRSQSLPGEFSVSWVENSTLLTRKKMPLRTPPIQDWGASEIWVQERWRQSQFVWKKMQRGIKYTV